MWSRRKHQGAKERGVKARRRRTLRPFPPPLPTASQQSQESLPLTTREKPGGSLCFFRAPGRSALQGHPEEAFAGRFDAGSLTQLFGHSGFNFSPCGVGCELKVASGNEPTAAKSDYFQGGGARERLWFEGEG